MWSKEVMNAKVCFVSWRVCHARRHQEGVWRNPNGNLESFKCDLEWTKDFKMHLRLMCQQVCRDMLHMNWNMQCMVWCWGFYDTRRVKYTWRNPQMEIESWKWGVAWVKEVNTHSRNNIKQKLHYRREILKLICTMGQGGPHTHAWISNCKMRYMEG